MTNATELMAVAERCAREAGALLLDHARRAPVAVESKSTLTDMVSAADRASEALLVSRLTALRPDDGLIGEEGAHRDGVSGLCWVVDPLDGTTNYLYRLPQWAVSVAVEDASGPVAGCVFDPGRGEAFTAARGAGAWLDGAPIRVSGTETLRNALIGTGFGYAADLRRAQATHAVQVIGEVRDLRRAGSAALDLAWVACGRLDGFYETGIMHWDWAAGRLLVTEAGGSFALPDGPHGRPQVVASNAALAASLTALVT
jgi:myo-inositol-1(or 4)-monophosphatase